MIQWADNYIYHLEKFNTGCSSIEFSKVEFQYITRDAELHNLL
jgi:hypothetical protein